MNSTTPGIPEAQSDRLATMRLTYAVGRLSRALHRRLADVIAEQRITPADYAVLSILRSRTDLTNAQIARRSLVSRQSAHQILGALEARGLVEVSESGHPDGRFRAMRLTAEGQAALARADELADELEDEVFADLDSEQRRRLVRDLVGWADAAHLG